MNKVFKTILGILISLIILVIIYFVDIKVCDSRLDRFAYSTVFSKVGT